MPEWLTLDVVNGLGTSTGFFAGLLIGRNVWLWRRK
jgi:hypothetical protein